MASKATHDSTVFGDEFLADEILARLPARCAVRCTTLSKRFRKLLASTHFWLRHGRLGPPLDLPHAARLQSHDDDKAHYFHVVGPTFAMEHAVKSEHPYCYASTCNGLVLLSRTSYCDKGQLSVDGLVFNPATKEEARLSLQLPHPGKEHVQRRIIGFGYGPSSKVYKALIREDDDDDETIRLMVVPLDGSRGQETRTVFSTDEDIICGQGLHTADGKMYFPISIMNIVGEGPCQIDEWDVTSVLAFDVDHEVVTSIAVPEGHHISVNMMEVRGRPCIYMEKGQKTVLWLLSTNDRWEQLYTLINESPEKYDCLKGVWDCGGGLLFALFNTSGANLYNLNGAAREDNEGSSGREGRLMPVSSHKNVYKWPEALQNMWISPPSNLWDYQPTLISPATILGDATFSDYGREIVAPKHELHEFDKMILEETRESVIDPAMQMLSTLGDPFGQLE